MDATPGFYWSDKFARTGQVLWDEPSIIELSCQTAFPHEHGNLWVTETGVEQDFPFNPNVYRLLARIVPPNCPRIRELRRKRAEYQKRDLTEPLTESWGQRFPELSAELESLESGQKI